MTTSRRPARRALLAATGSLALALPVVGCSPEGEAGAGGAPLALLASFYPLELVAERVGGDLVDVRSLTPAGAEPHDLELSPAQVRAVGAADVVLLLAGFQPAVDEAVAARSPERVVDVAEAAGLREAAGTSTGDPEGVDQADAHGDEEDGLDGRDPHFWLDPTRLAAVADRVAGALGEALPGEADAFAARAEALRAELAALDEEFAEGLASCETRMIVTAHEAFGYLADRYDLRQVGISGLDPESEPSPARLREVAATVEDEGVTTVFYETLVSPKVAEVLAADLGIDAAVLDPVEGLVDPEEDYFSVMRANLAALRTALRCA
jgi:zinc transport system substrate-binding protein